MLRYILTRILWLFLTLFVVFTMLFIVARFAEIERMEVLTFIDLTFREKIEIVYRDYVLYIQNILSDWDWGRDRRSRDAWSELVKRTDLTLRLNIFHFSFIWCLG